MGKKKNKPKFHCKSEAQKRAIAANYARKAAQSKQQLPSQPKPAEKSQKQFPDKFPFWARFKKIILSVTVMIKKSSKKRVAISPFRLSALISQG